MNAMVLCAGLGTRLRPITEDIPKPLAPVFDIPAVAYILETLAASGVKRVVINLHHLPGKVMDCIGDSFRGMQVVYSHEPEILGAVGGVAKALEYFDDGPILVVNGDILVDFDPVELMNTHINSGAALTMALGDIEGRDELRLVGVDSRTKQVSRIRGHQAKDLTTDEMLVNLGVFVYDDKILKKYVSPGKSFGFTEGLIPLLMNGCEIIMSTIVNGYWNDIGNAGAYLQAHLDALSGKGTKGCLKAASDSSNKPACDIQHPVFIGENACVETGAVLGPFAIIGKNSVIGEGAVIERSLLLPGARIAPGAKITNSVVHGDLVIKT